ncbi:trigger factor [Acetivibrio saccincola]|jgi:trigger factor|uniref:Trigger factor n=1 Tax=Acetivibrio saccincola TaxID=1677857 RepID=A0A2K9EPD5_9FIRM|nr:trigger factor [Acetivibrio saccincola]AUG58491.1 Trigger factor [Acetivibrio saccincola]PQQ66308.1 trigger factor [Acetivibrio saccincola]HOA97551.1 trigger factor [Acetivibrio saccincola]HQD28633.1 trigger factor [Acetivibrio saccincola]
MNVKLEKKEKNIVELEIEVDAGVFEEGLEKAFRKNAKRFNVPGFRKGKAPRNIVERYYGPEVFYEDALNEIFPKAYEEAVKETNIFPVDRPELDIKQIGKGQNLIFTASVTVKPEVELGEYKGIEIEKIEVNITDEDVEKEIQKVAEKNARIITVEDRGIQEGDIAEIDFEGFIDGEPFEGGKGSDFPLEIGSGKFIKGFEEQLIGGRPGDDIEVKVTFPEDYGSEELAGKDAVFKVIVNDVKKKELPVIDDEFAKDVSEFDTLEEYKEDLRKKLTDAAEHRAKHELENKLIEKIVDNAKVEIPKVMVDKQLDANMREFDASLRYQGFSLEQYLQMAQMDIDTFREQGREMAEKEVKTQLVLEKISQVENIQASDEEFEEEVKKLSEKYQKDKEEFMKLLRDDDIEYIKSTIIARKTIDFLVENAKIE